MESSPSPLPEKLPPSLESSCDGISELFANELLIMKVGLYTFKCFGEASLVSDAPVTSRSPFEAYPLIMAEELIPAAPVDEDDIFFLSPRIFAWSLIFFNY